MAADISPISSRKIVPPSETSNRPRLVAIAPVTDLQQQKDDFRNYTSASNVADYIGTGPHVAEGSPLRFAEDEEIPDASSAIPKIVPACACRCARW